MSECAPHHLVAARVLIKVDLRTERAEQMDVDRQPRPLTDRPRYSAREHDGVDGASSAPTRE